MSDYQAYIQKWKHVANGKRTTQDLATVALTDWLNKAINSGNSKIEATGVEYYPNYATPISYSEVESADAWVLWSSVTFSLNPADETGFDVQAIAQLISDASKCRVHVVRKSSTISHAATNPSQRE